MLLLDLYIAWAMLMLIAVAIIYLVYRLITRRRNNRLMDHPGHIGGIDSVYVEVYGHPSDKSIKSQEDWDKKHGGKKK